MNNEVVKREEQVMSILEVDQIREQVNSLLGKDDKKMEIFKTRILKICLNDGLKKCSPESIIECGIQALTLNLPLEAGQGYVVAYKSKATLDIGYKGWQVLAKRSGYLVMADIVYSCDQFSQSGFGFNKEMHFTPDYASRQSANNKWAKANLEGVIVSIKDIESGQDTSAFVAADMIHKIVASSPSANSDYSPHNNWTEQMYIAKAIKQVISKMPVDLTRSNDLQSAINLTNISEQSQQAKATNLDTYPQEKFDSYFPTWKTYVETGRTKARSILTQLQAQHTLTPEMTFAIAELKSFEPLDGEIEEQQQ
jgi:recombination protein RecT